MTWEKILKRKYTDKWFASKKINPHTGQGELAELPKDIKKRILNRVDELLKSYLGDIKYRQEPQNQDWLNTKRGNYLALRKFTENERQWLEEEIRIWIYKLLDVNKEYTEMNFSEIEIPDEDRRDLQTIRSDYIQEIRQDGQMKTLLERSSSRER
jgi:hypothetical protein